MRCLSLGCGVIFTAKAMTQNDLIFVIHLLVPFDLQPFFTAKLSCTSFHFMTKREDDVSRVHGQADSFTTHL